MTQSNEPYVACPSCRTPVKLSLPTCPSCNAIVLQPAPPRLDSHVAAPKYGVPATSYVVPAVLGIGAIAGVVLATRAVACDPADSDLDEGDRASVDPASEPQ